MLRPHPLLKRYYGTEDERRRRLDRWFDATAPAYDWISQVMSFGSSRWYRRRAMVRAGLEAGMELLDVACGTGISTAPAAEIVGEAGGVVGLDPSFGMLRQARRAGQTHLVRAIGERLPLADASFDFLTMSYALRHVADLRGTFREFCRVLRPGGTVLILEITPPASRLGRVTLKLYMKYLVAFVARFGPGGRDGRELMEYYWDTIEACVPPATILETLETAGFAGCDRYRELGIFSEYRGTRGDRGGDG